MEVGPIREAPPRRGRGGIRHRKWISLGRNTKVSVFLLASGSRPFWMPGRPAVGVGRWKIPRQAFRGCPPGSPRHSGSRHPNGQPGDSVGSRARRARLCGSRGDLHLRARGGPACRRVPPFGHGKIEHLSAFIETSLLLATCTLIILEAIRRVFFRQVHVEPSVWAFGVMLISITIDTFRSRALMRVARKYNSQALEADALHFSTDVYSSSVVILGLILVYVAQHWDVPWLQDADPVAALVVAGIIIYISIQLGKRTVDALVDAAPEGTFPSAGGAGSGAHPRTAKRRPAVRGFAAHARE